MLTFKTRQAYGFLNDNFSGYIALKDGNPALQIHFYDEYYTLFWRGHVSLGQLEECLTDLIRQISSEHKVLIENINSGRAQYSWNGQLVSTPFSIEPQNEQQKNQLREHHDLVARLRRENNSGPSFVKFEFQARIPIVLWAELNSSGGGAAVGADSEIGFSSRASLPPAILQLIYKTCFTRLAPPELDRISVRWGGLITRFRKLWGKQINP